MIPPLSMNAAAASLGVSRRWLQDFLGTIPPCHLQAGHRKLFDDAALATIREAMRREAQKCRTALSPQKRGGRRITASGGPNSTSELTELRKLLTAGKRKSSSPNAEPKPNVLPFPAR